MGTIEKHTEISCKEKGKFSPQPTDIRKFSMQYMMFMYLEERLYHNKKKREVVLCRRKLNLTRKLLHQSMNHIEEYNVQELININREVDYANSLRDRINHMSPKK